MKIEIIALSLLTVLMTGCREDRKECAGVGLAEIPNLDVVTISDGLRQDFDRRMLRFVETAEADEQRIAIVRLLLKRLLSVQMDGLPYSVQRRVMGRISHFVEVPLVHNCLRTNERMLRCEVRLALVEWYRHQLARLKPNQKNDKEIRVWPDYATARKSGEWYDCYMGSFLAYRSLVNRMEFWWFPEESKEMDASEVTMMRERIEKCLGRPIRKPTGSRADWDWETEEVSKVKAGRLFRIE